MSYEGFVTWDEQPHDCGPYCEHPGPNGIHKAALPPERRSE